MNLVMLTYDQHNQLTELMGKHLESMGLIMAGVTAPTITSIEEVTVDNRPKFLIRFTYSFDGQPGLYRGHLFAGFGLDDPKILTNFTVNQGVCHEVS